MTLPITITPRTLAAAVGVLIAAAGIIVLLWPVTTSLNVGPFSTAETVSCGNALISNDPYGAAGAGACADALGAHRGWGWPLLIAGSLLAAAALFVQIGPQAREDA